MANPRKPVAVAEATGATIKNPQRHRGRSRPKVDRIGPAPKYLAEELRPAWDLFVSELPWLGSSDRAILELAVPYRARVMAGDILGINATTEYRQLLAKLGATPSDRSKIHGSPEDDEPDPAKEFLN